MPDDPNVPIQPLDPRSSPLDLICKKWDSCIKASQEHKASVFGNQANECNRFYSSFHDFMYEGKYGVSSKGFMTGQTDSEIEPPIFRATANKTAELVELFGPILYHRNPNRRVRPRDPPVPPPEIFGAPTAPPPEPPPGVMLDPMQMQQLAQM